MVTKRRLSRDFAQKHPAENPIVAPERFQTDSPLIDWSHGAQALWIQAHVISL